MNANPWEWTEADLQQLIATQRQESIDLEYKGCDALQKNSNESKKELSKDVSAFANSAGGTLVYGIREDTTKNYPSGFDVGYDPTDITKEWIEQVINSRIQRKIDGVRIAQVALPTQRPGKVAYVVYVPQSLRAPHRASDYRYYKRYNFESVPMEDYEVRDVCRRAETADLHLELSLVGGPEVRLIRSEPVAITGRITNDAPAPANYTIITLLFDPLIVIVNYAGFNLCTTPTSLAEIGNKKVKAIQVQRGINNGPPFFKGTAFTVTPPGMPIQVNIPEEPGDYIIGWQLDSPNMPQKVALFNLHSEGGKVSILGQPPKQPS